ncbi:MAG TPA: hypothetical protein V6D20_01340 [Candidatus Obscuribacterales bacterium]
MRIADAGEVVLLNHTRNDYEMASLNLSLGRAIARQFDGIIKAQAGVVVLGSDRPLE